MNPAIKVAYRYLSNAKELLEEKALREKGEYRDKKYIRLAGHAAYCGALLALNQLMGINKKNKRKSVEDYRVFLTRYDKKMLSVFNNLYIILHLGLGYDGITDALIIKRGMSMAKELIEKVASRLN